MKLKLAMIGVIVLAAAFVVVIALRNPQAPPLPDNATHFSFFDGKSCMFCHGPRKEYPQGPNHPIGEDCTRCHAMPKR